MLTSGFCRGGRVRPNWAGITILIFVTLTGCRQSESEWTPLGREMLRVSPHVPWPAPAQPPPPPSVNGITVTPVGVSLVARNLLAELRTQAPGGADPGTTLALLVRAERDQILSLDASASGIARFTDDAGGDLMTGAEGSHWRSRSGVVSLASEGEPTALIAEFTAPNLPKAGANRAFLEGTLAVVVAGPTQYVRIQNVQVKKGNLAKAPFAVEIVHVGRPTLVAKDCYPFAVKMQIRKGAGSRGANLTSLCGVDLLDGENDSSLHVRRKDNPDPPPGTAEVELYFNRKVERATIELQYVRNTRTVTLPLNLSVSLGEWKSEPKVTPKQNSK